MKIRLLLTGATLALVLSSTLPARAQRTGFAVNRFEPAERGSQFFVNDTLDFRGHGRPAIGMTLDYGYKPLVVYERGDTDTERAAIVRHQLFSHFGASVVLWERLRLGVNLPIALYQDGEASAVGRDVFRGANGAALGDLRLAADLRIVGQYGDPFVIAGGVRGWIPTGSRAEFTSDGSFRIAPQVMIAGDLSPFTYAARVSIVYRGRDDTYAGSNLGSELVGNAGVGLKALDGKLVIGPEVFAQSVFTSSDAFLKTRGSPAEWIFGGHLDIGEFRAGAGVGGGLTRGYGSPQVRGLLSLEYVGSVDKPDNDKDGIPNDVDACPNAAGDPNPDPKKNGCPPENASPADADGDGILDAEDACPREPGVRTDDPATNGCPDRDNDGIIDRLDACPEVAGVRDADPKKNGCPPDRDGDGIADSFDACPDVPGVKDPDPKKNGCPADTDGDGILDPDDACPKVAGPKNADPKKNGCPLVVITEKAIQINEQVKFKFDSAELLAESDGILGAVKKVLDEHPEIGKLRVEGHSDNVGKADYNKKLSQRRAESVMKWLTDRGVDKKRLKAQGFGQEEPIDSNATDTGRANNRRVAFTILERDDKKAPAPPGSGAPTPAPKP